MEAKIIRGAFGDLASSIDHLCSVCRCAATREIRLVDGDSGAPAGSKFFCEEHYRAPTRKADDGKMILIAVAEDMGFSDAEYIADAILERLNRYGFAVIASTENPSKEPTP